MSDMILLAEAKALLSHHPFTLADARALEALEEEAVGEEGLCIAELWEAASVRPTRRPGTICLGRSDPYPRGFMTHKSAGLLAPRFYGGHHTRWRGS